MDWFPLINSLRIALFATAITFCLGILAAYWVAKLPPVIKGLFDVVFTIPLVLPPTVVGFFLLKALSPTSAIGGLLGEAFDVTFTMTWYASILAVTIVTFPLMYRTVRASFEAFDQTLIYAGQTLGRSNRWIFFHVLLPGCKQGLIAGGVLAFARGLGEYGATSMVSGYTPGRTATISTTVYQLWREGNDSLAYRWVFVNLAISFTVLLAVNLLERKQQKKAQEREVSYVSYS